MKHPWFMNRASHRGSFALLLGSAIAASGCLAPGDPGDDSDRAANRGGNLGSADRTDAEFAMPSSVAGETRGNLVLPPRLAARAVLPALTFAPGPSSGQFLGRGPINGVTPPFIDKQPVQGVSAVLREADGSYLAMSDNGYGAIENSADFHLRVYRIRPSFKTLFGGPGTISVQDFVELRDPDGKIPFAIANQFSSERVLTGADFDIESIRKSSDGSLWFGDEFGPFLLHTDASGRVLEPPIRVPGDLAGQELRSPQNPYSEEGSAIRIMNAVRGHARAHGASYAPVFSPSFQLLADADPATFVENRQNPPAGSGLTSASSELFNVAALKTAGYPVVPYTINDPIQMTKLMKLGVSGIISDRPDLLLQEVANFDANSDGVPGDWLDSDGLIDPSKLDAQGHRGARNLRPENTLPAFEAALDSYMTTLETDIGLTRERVAVLDHDPHVQSQKCRRSDGTIYELADEVLVKDLSLAQLQAQYICDKLFRGPSQQNAPELSPAVVAFRAANPELPHIYAMPSLAQLFAFVSFYADYYSTGAGAAHPQAAKRARNARRVRFNLETKINPRTEFAARTFSPRVFARVLGTTIVRSGLADRADIQSFDFRSLLLVQELFPRIRTVYLFGDFPVFADRSIPGSDDGTNLQPEGANTPWLAGLYWPYRSTAVSNPITVKRSGGFEGMALSSDGTRLYPILEAPVTGDDAKTLRIYEFDLARRQFVGVRATYRLDDRGTNIGDFTMLSRDNGLIIERDPSQGDVQGFKRIYQVQLGAVGAAVDKRLAVDLQTLWDPFRISLPGQPGDVGLGTTFSFPFETIESVVVLGRRTIGVLCDNNFPFSKGRHLGTGAPDDTEFIVVDVGRNLY
jgi:glycerophosphoryl diester phosphodiesterase